MNFHLLHVLVLLVARAARTSAQCTVGYPGPNATLMCTCDAGYTGGNFIGPYSTTACARFIALITWKPSFASVANRADAAIGTLPTYVAGGGPTGHGHVSFNRDLGSQYLGFGPCTLNIATNTGFTMVAVIQFTGAILMDDHLIDSWKWVGYQLKEVIVQRYMRTSRLQYEFCNAGNACQITVSPVGMSLQQDTWGTVVLKYSSLTTLVSFSVNNAEIVGPSNIGALWDKSVAGITLGRGAQYNDAGTTNKWWAITANVAGVFLVDEYLSTNATTTIVQAMTEGVDLTDTTCPSGKACKECARGEYKIATGPSSCLTCPVDDTSHVCTPAVPPCDAGYTGPDGGPCTACVAGTYKSATGSLACTGCGEYETTTTGSSSAAACVCRLGYGI